MTTTGPNEARQELVYDLTADGKYLETMFELQRRLMTELGLKEDWGPHQVHSYEFLRLLLSLTREVSEAADEVADASKPWKHGTVPDEVRRDRIIEELVDVFFYTMEAFIMLGCDSEKLIVGYAAKWAKNIKRLQAAREGHFENA